MKSIFALTVATIALSVAHLAPAAAQADPYRWCAQMGGGNDGGATNCYFITRAQCEATVSGVGGFCRHNQFYTGPQAGYETDDVPPRRIDRKRGTR
jgi:hypothetical protein